MHVFDQKYQEGKCLLIAGGQNGEQIINPDKG